jgi:hypothetical protein
LLFPEVPEKGAVLSQQGTALFEQIGGIPEIRIDFSSGSSKKPDFLIRTPFFGDCR